MSSTGSQLNWARAVQRTANLSGTKTTTPSSRRSPPVKAAVAFALSS